MIIGGKGTAINIAEQIEDARLRFGYSTTVLGFAIDDPSLGKEIGGFRVVCGVREAWTKFRDTETDFIFALYRPDVMFERVALLRELGIPVTRFANFVHPSAYISRTVSMGHGNVVLSHACLQHSVSLGDFNIINSHVVVEHEANFRDGAFVAACACIGAHVRVGTGAFVGLNSTVREKMVIADYAFVGMASTVVQSIGQGVVAYGVPARPRR
ncbi:MAG: sialic acid O-acetyltransferase [Candidatus Accumulibacter sp.]|uniref:sialic acid O-acetyltransferase n=1 Tax=Candidatus Accumulibacter necessarius TaxID=2954386 RepID=UPI001AD2961C|nr:sialic acid O-acetyltransferase [Candidatus Accumulibacter necessarius]